MFFSGDLELSRAEASLNNLKNLSPASKVKVINTGIDSEEFYNNIVPSYGAVLVTIPLPKQTLAKLNRACRSGPYIYIYISIYTYI